MDFLYDYIPERDLGDQEQMVLRILKDLGK